MKRVPAGQARRLLVMAAKPQRWNAQNRGRSERPVRLHSESIALIIPRSPSRTQDLGRHLASTGTDRWSPKW